MKVSEKIDQIRLKLESIKDRAEDSRVKCLLNVIVCSLYLRKYKYTLGVPEDEGAIGLLNGIFNDLCAWENENFPEETNDD